jgi:hypothetical protein
MRTAIFAIFFLCLSTHALAQSTVEGQQIILKKCKSEHVRIFPDKSGQGYPDLFNEIRVLDARPDTSRIGIVRTGISIQTDILLEGPVAAQLTGYLNTTYARPKGSHSLLIVLKNLWIASSYHFRFHVDAYLQAGDGFMPLISMDSTLHFLKGETAASMAEIQTREMFAEFMDRLASGDLDKERRTVSAGQIDSFNQARFAYLMDTATHLEKGCYRSFQEFLNNTPSIGNAEFTTDKNGDFALRIPDENGQLSYTRTVWGYCDGSLFPIFTVYHQLYVLGSIEYRRKRIFVPFLIPLGPGALIGVTHIDLGVAKSLRILRINANNGHVIE